MADAKLIMKLRKATQVGMMECKKALEEANDDFEAAIDILRKSGAAKAAKKSDREAHEGVVRVAITDDKKKGSIARINCETDFVAKNEDFVAAVDDIVSKSLDASAEDVFAGVKDELVLKMGENIQLGEAATLEGEYMVGYMHSNNKVGALIAFSGSIDEEVAKDIAMHTVAMSPRCLSREQVSQDDLDREKDIYKEQLKAEGKPDDIIEKILVGKMDKYYSEYCLLEQAFIKDEKKTISDLLGDVSIVDFKLFSV